MPSRSRDLPVVRAETMSLSAVAVPSTTPFAPFIT